MRGCRISWRGRGRRDGLVFSRWSRGIAGSGKERGLLEEAGTVVGC